MYEATKSTSTFSLIIIRCRNPRRNRNVVSDTCSEEEHASSALQECVSISSMYVYICVVAYVESARKITKI